MAIATGMAPPQQPFVHFFPLERVQDVKPEFLEQALSPEGIELTKSEPNNVLHQVKYSAHYRYDEAARVHHLYLTLFCKQSIGKVPPRFSFEAFHFEKKEGELGVNVVSKKQSFSTRCRNRVKRSTSLYGEVSIQPLVPLMQYERERTESNICLPSHKELDKGVKKALVGAPDYLSSFNSPALSSFNSPALSSFNSPAKHNVCAEQALQLKTLSFLVNAWPALLLCTLVGTFTLMATGFYMTYSIGKHLLPAPNKV